MHTPVLFRVLSRMCQFTALALMASALVGLLYQESVWVHYAATAALALVVSAVIYAVGSRFPGESDRPTRREGFLAVVTSWLLVILFGAVPFWLSGSIPSFTDAFFESASGFTTTGATILGDIEALPHAHLFQRSLAHWIGGMGIIVLSIAILPELAVGGMQLFSAESSGISTDKLSPRIVSTARRLWWLYATMTLALVLLLLAGNMDLFDAVTHAFGTLATGGFSTRNASVGAFNSLYIETVIMIFMLVSGISFSLHYRFYVRGDWRPMVRSSEVRLYLGIFVLFTLAITGTLVVEHDYDSYGSALRVASFQTAAILTTTGFGTADFDRWPDLCRYLLVLLMFLGGCAGSTAGGVKVIRLLVVIKHTGVELKKLLYPRLVKPVRIDAGAIQQSTIQAILGFFMLYISTTVVATALVLMTGVDLVTGVTAVVSAMNSIGPGLGLVGPAHNFGDLPATCKWVLSICMIVGRLEIYTVFVLLTREFWR
jgi:trk system potassium uptake protein TrkH